MATFTATEEGTKVSSGPQAALFSADSHVIEERSLWDGILPNGFFGPPADDGNARAGRVDPVARIDEMAIDGVDGEVLYPTLGLRLFGLEEASLQEACFSRYNSWLGEFCATSPEKLTGIGLISCYDIDHAVAELERCVTLGMRGIEVWQTPYPQYPFSSAHYDPLWAAAASLGLPVSLHILTGDRTDFRALGLPTKIGEGGTDTTIAQVRFVVNHKLLSACDALLEIIFSGVFDRFPKLNIVLVENEIGWIPYVLDQFDFYASEKFSLGMGRLPSEYFGSQLFATFFRDPVGMRMFDWWGASGCMWSSDYPHGNSTWPNSQKVVDENLGYLSSQVRETITRGTARRLYRLDPPAG